MSTTLVMGREMNLKNQPQHPKAHVLQLTPMLFFESSRRQIIDEVDGEYETDGEVVCVVSSEARLRKSNIVLSCTA